MNEIVKNVLFAVSVVGAAAAVVWGRVKRVHVSRPYVWANWRTPRVAFSEGIDDRALVEAVKFWTDLGHKIEISSPEDATILFRVDEALDARAGYDDHAITYAATRLVFNVQDGDKIVSAHVRHLPNVDALTIAHELGHALGYGHPVNAPSGHLMNPRASRVGWNARGLSLP